MQKPLEVWGGVECSVIRLQDDFRDQLKETGHDTRIADLDAIAALGIRTLRYPFLWERLAPRKPQEISWAWQDRRAQRMQQLGITPIAGLLHHGSGPRYTNLADPALPCLFASFAGKVAERYPWIQHWTPVNEPLTTARFSGLYGFWYPHGTSEELFWHLLLNQIEATAAAMKAIRGVRSDALLIQSEDIGAILATPNAQAEADFRNHRRWLTWDLLCGRVDRQHPLWKRIAAFGLGDRLRAIADAPCPPDMLGLNHYLTSNRFLDGRDETQACRYTDVEAVRVHTAPPGLETLARECWDRYQIPLAFTEVHNGCTREEQLRWFFQAWNAALRLRAGGAEVKAVTSWALLGCMDWASLLMRREGIYEVGAFDVSGGQSRPTALSRLLQSFATEKTMGPPLSLAQGSGWWNRPIRFAHAPYGPFPPEVGEPAAAPPLLVIGRGRLGLALEASCKLRGLPVAMMHRPQLDITSLADIEKAIGEVQPWAVINATGLSSVADAERDPASCFAVNCDGAAALSTICGRRHIVCVTCSSDLVFSGKSATGYCENDPPDPPSIYGRSKQMAEQFIARERGHQLIVRSAAFFGSGGFAARVAGQLASGCSVYLHDHHTFTPSYLPDIANAILDLVIDGEAGIWHLTHGEPVSKAGFAAKIANALKIDPSRVRPATAGRIERRNTALSSQKGRLLPSLDNAVARFAADFVAGRGRSPPGSPRAG